MEKESARNQTLEQLHERRKQAVRLHKKAIKIMKIVELTGLSYPTVRATFDRFKEGGWAAIRPARRGRTKGDGQVLSAAQEAALQRIIIDKHPEQLKMDFFLWSRAAVGQLIKQEYDIKLPARSIGKYLARWGFTPPTSHQTRLQARHRNSAGLPELYHQQQIVPRQIRHGSA